MLEYHVFSILYTNLHIKSDGGDMAQTTLGLDLGITSIGWSLISEDGSHVNLIDWGSRIFQAGMDDDIEQGKGVSRCAERRQKRALRVQYQRRKKRKDDLIRLLQENDFLPEPLKPDFFVTLDNKYLMLFPKDQRKTIGHVIPYLYRKKALYAPLTKEELGRTIYHLAQRRGYLSNRKQELKNEEESGKVKAGIDELKAAMKKTGARTLGEYFCMVNPEESRIRTRYTERAMYQDEFRQICEAQRNLIPEDLEKQLFRVIFFQRKLKSCKNLIGNCSIYPEEKRCSYACEEAQMFRIYTTLNHLRIEKSQQIRSLTKEEREKTLAVLNGFSGLLSRKGTITLRNLAKAIPLAKGEKFTLSDDEKEIHGNILHAILFSVFGSRAESLSEAERIKFFNDLNSIEKTEVLKRRLKNYWLLTDDQIAIAEKAAVPDDYCAFSLKALKELLPDLEAGIPLSTIQKLNHPSLPQDEQDLLPMLDSDEVNIELRNPVVHRVLTELRIVVNAIIKRYGKPDRIRIELARDLKATNKERERHTREIREREKERAEIARKIAEEAGIQNPSRNDILKVMLAEECGYQCPYTGQHFSMYDLLHGKDIHIEHIIPYSRSFDDSFRNKTLCLAAANAKKNNHTPFEAFSGDEYQLILQRVAHFNGPLAETKLELFKLEQVEPQEFLERNLNDTRYASRLAMQYIAMLYGGTVDKAGKQRVFATSGSCTAMIRRSWGGNYLLGEGEKVRDDHRHHAIDALTIALTTPEMVKTIASMPPEQRRKKLTDDKKTVFDNEIFLQAAAKIDNIPVSHHVINKVKGPLHKETFYSKNYGNGIRHKRIRLENLSFKDVPDIVDPAVKALILKRIGCSEKQLADLTEKKFSELLDVSTPLLFTNRNGEPVNTIKAVRVSTTVTTRTIGSGNSAREVANDSNYLLAVFAVLDEKGNETAWEVETVSLLDARLRLNFHLPLFEKNRPGRKFKFTLKKGDLIKIGGDDNEQLLIVCHILNPKNDSRYFACYPINDARKIQDLKAAKVFFRPAFSKLFNKGITKYHMNIFGELQRAND